MGADDLPSERPADFDLAAHWKSSTERFKEEWPRYEATLEVIEPKSLRDRVLADAAAVIERTRHRGRARGPAPGAKAGT